MSNDRYQDLREAAWRRPLTDAEQAGLQAWLAAHPDARADWETEIRLNAGLRKLPDVPVPSNFTARVLQEVKQTSAAGDRARLWNGRGFDLRRWLPRLAAGGLAAGVVLASVQYYKAANRAKLGASVVAFSEVMPSPSPDYLADFDTIRRLAPAHGADTELLTLLQ